MRLQEIEYALNQLRACPKCASREGFWLGVKGDSIHAQCKSCGKGFELSKILASIEKPKTMGQTKSFLRSG